MKKITAVILAAVMLLCFAACGNGGGSKASAAPEIAVDGNEYVYGYELKDGTYEIKVETNASMFKVVHCELIVENGSMTAVMSLSGEGYDYLYAGTGEMAAADSEDKYIPFERDSEDRKAFRMPIAALDCEIRLASHSIKKDQWYDRSPVFESGLIPEDAYRTIKAVDVKLSGGTGKAGIKSPTLIAEDNGNYVAVLEWSSPNYTYMIVDGKEYYPVNIEGNSTFAIPVGLDKDIAVSAETSAMSQPHLIDYTLHFDGSSLRDR